MKTNLSHKVSNVHATRGRGVASPQPAHFRWIFRNGGNDEGRVAAGFAKAM
jgi:hypothetical protein